MRWPALALGLVFLLLALATCATPTTAGMCPEARRLRFLTHQTCTRDTSRGCMVCTCDPPLFQDRTREERSGQDLPTR
jgi:hypothetical protein